MEASNDRDTDTHIHLDIPHDTPSGLEERNEIHECISDEMFREICDHGVDEWQDVNAEGGALLQSKDTQHSSIISMLHVSKPEMGEESEDVITDNDNRSLHQFEKPPIKMTGCFT